MARAARSHRCGGGSPIDHTRRSAICRVALETQRGCHATVSPEIAATLRQQGVERGARPRANFAFEHYKRLRAFNPPRSYGYARFEVSLGYRTGIARFYHENSTCWRRCWRLWKTVPASVGAQRRRRLPPEERLHAPTRSPLGGSLAEALWPWPGATYARRAVWIPPQLTET